MEGCSFLIDSFAKCLFNQTCQLGLRARCYSLLVVVVVVVLVVLVVVVAHVGWVVFVVLHLV
jgi:hypothetical protein